MILLSQVPATCPAHHIFVAYSEQSHDNDADMFAVTASAFRVNAVYIPTATWKAQTHPECNNNTLIYVKVNQVAGVSQQSMCLFSVFCTAVALQHVAGKLS
jgi:hypothetical protein